jgi:hypothetical protein
MVPAARPAKVPGSPLARSAARSIRSRAAPMLVTSSMASSASANSPARQPRGSLRAIEAASRAARRRVNSATADSSRYSARAASRRHRAQQLAVAQPARLGGGLLGERGQHRAGPQHIRGVPPGERLAAQPVRPGHRGQPGQVHVRGVAQADAGGRALDLPRLGNPRPAGLDIGQERRHLRVGVPVTGRPARHPIRGTARHPRPAPDPPGRGRSPPGPLPRPGNGCWSTGAPLIE